MQLESIVPFDRLKAFIHQSLTAPGLSDSDAMTVATLMAEVDPQGSDGHGVTRPPSYARTNSGQAISAINVAAFGDVPAFKASGDSLVRDLRGSSRMTGVEWITVPGECSHETRAFRIANGIPIAPQLVRGLDQLTTELGTAKLT